jgi:tetratricopeptide (TPR) repeat protein
MHNINEELGRAEQEMRSGALNRAAAILNALRTDLESTAGHPHLSEQERLLGLVKVLNNIGVVEKNQGNLEAATLALESALDISAKLEDGGIKQRTGILSNLGLLYSRRRLYAKGWSSFEEALTLADQHPQEIDPSFIVRLRNNRALFFVRFGELDKARDELAFALEAGRGRERGENVSEREAWLNANLAMIHAELGDEELYDVSRREEMFRQARAMFLRSAELYGSAGYTDHKLKQLINVAEIEIRLGALEESRRRLREAGREAEKLNMGRILCEIGHVSVELALRSGDREQVLNRVRELLELLKTHNPPDLQTRQAKLENLLRRTAQKEALSLLADAGAERQSSQNAPKPSTA